MNAPSSDAEAEFSIADLAQDFAITTRTIRFYEDKGLLQPARRGKHRVYSRADRTRLKLVLRGKRLGWPLDDIREMIELYDLPDGERRQLNVMLSRIQQSRSVLLQQKADIERALHEFDDIEARCRRQLHEQ
ncbi:MAG: MerR family DNA-binding transcriptional regulator [Granulosicoccus sp.]|nr:MerR family DNA-binding transcriptional regulator [Granulosicoccus sp.]